MIDPMNLFQQLWQNPGAIEQMAQKAAMQGSPEKFMQGLQQAKQAMPEFDIAQQGAGLGTAGPMSPMPQQGNIGPMSPVPMQPQMAYGQGPGQATPQGVPNPAFGQPSPLGAALQPSGSSGFAGPLGSPRAAGAEGPPTQAPGLQPGQPSDADAHMRAAMAWKELQGQQQGPPKVSLGSAPSLGASALAGAPVSALYQSQAQPGIGAALAQALRGRRF